MLRDSREARHRDGKQTSLDSAEGLPMDANQFRQTLLRQARLNAGLFHVSPDTAQNLTVVHLLQRTPFRECLTPNILSVNISPLSHRKTVGGRCEKHRIVARGRRIEPKGHLCLFADLVKARVGSAKAGSIARKYWK